MNLSKLLQTFRFPVAIRYPIMAVRKSSRVTPSSQVLSSKEPPIPSKITKVTKRQSAGKSNNGVPTRKRKTTLASPTTPVRVQAKGTPEPTLSLSKRPKGTKDRPAGLHITNALLISPETSRIVQYSDALGANQTPSKPQVSPPTTSTVGLLEEAYAHLIKADPKMKPLIEQFPCHMFSTAGLAEEMHPFRSLVSSIIGQQVSGAAARSIKRKFVSLFDAIVLEDEAMVNIRFPKPSQVIAMTVEQLRPAGLSQRKAEYIHGLSEKFANGELSADLLMRASDEELMEMLIAVRGLGKWSVEMFACFTLKRMDIFSTGDLGVQRGLAAFVGKDVKKLKSGGKGKWKYMSEADMLMHSKKFAPYRSLFMWYMWRVEDVDTSAIEVQT